MGTMMNNTQSLGPIYPRITEYADASYGDDTYCLRGCGERRAVCPDCTTAVCVFCDDECIECGESVF